VQTTETSKDYYIRGPYCISGVSNVRPQGERACGAICDPDHLSYRRRILGRLR